MKFSDQDRFEIWLMEMESAIQSFLESAPESVASRLDFSNESLSAIESWIMALYEGPGEIMRPEDSHVHDGAARYIGQTFRRVLGGVWKIDFSDSENVFFGVPQISGMSGQKSQFCPHALVTSLLDRRKGNYLVTIFNNMLSAS